MVELVCAGALALLIWALMAKQPIIRTLARIFTGVLTLASAAATIFLFKVGQQAHWTSDGPAMAVIMLGILLCGIFALVFGGLFFNSFNRSS